MMKHLRTILFAGLSVCLASAGFAQQHFGTQTIHKCMTTEHDSLFRLKHPQVGSLMDFENDLQQRIAETEGKNRTARTAAVITIPVVVHIVHNGEPVGQGTNLSAAQVQSQLDVLNEDFRRKPGTRGFNSNPVGADIEIEFCVATLDPQGRTMTEPGIHRYNGRKSVWAYEEVESTLKSTTIWDPNKYYNIWVVNFTGTGAGGTTLGYAQFPVQSGLEGLTGGATGANTDGVVILYRAFGSSDKGSFPGLGQGFDKGRTLTHETGHWLGLRHIWGDGRCAEDFCADTPPAESATNGCPTGRVSCGVTNQIENYMDYTNDVCQNLFTRNQKTRMLRVMEVSPRRRSLLSSNVCGNVVAAAPVADFQADRQLILLGASVNFTDLSSNFPTSWRWTFEGGEPATSTDRNPTVVYNTPGRYRVTLAVSNRVGSNTLVRENFIEVSEAGLCSQVTNFDGTPALLSAPLGNVQAGYVAGQNNLKKRAESEFFANPLGYANLSGVALRFGYVSAASPDAVVTVVAWNARGFQGGPGAVLERKDVLLSQIQQDVQRGEPTQIVFDRNVPLFGRGFHVGIELAYEGDTVALITTRNGESTSGTSWEQDSTGQWSPYALSQGLNIAHDITPFVGMKSSVQVASSALVINAGESVTLNARGAGVFSWSGANLSDTLGAQVIARPTETTTYAVTGSGLDLCQTTASVTVVVRGTVAVPPEELTRQLTIYPNPGTGLYRVSLENTETGAVQIALFNPIGSRVTEFTAVKNARTFEQTLNLQTLPSGVYMVTFKLNGQTVRKRIVKL